MGGPVRLKPGRPDFSQSGGPCRCNCLLHCTFLTKTRFYCKICHPLLFNCLRCLFLAFFLTSTLMIMPTCRSTNVPRLYGLCIVDTFVSRVLPGCKIARFAATGLMNAFPFCYLYNVFGFSFCVQYTVSFFWSCTYEM